MRLARFCLLLLLALVLPLRGALAQAQPCSAGHTLAMAAATQPRSAGPAAPLASEAVPADAGAGYSDHHLHSGKNTQGEAGHAPGHSPAHAHAHGPADAEVAVATADTSQDPLHDSSSQVHGQCSACASCCLGAPLAHAGVKALPVLPPAGTVKFSAESAPVASVVLAGLERPPRAL